MRRLRSSVYGLVVYVLFLATFLYAIAFARGLFVPKPGRREQ